MIEIDYQLLSKEAVDNLMMELISREATDYGEKEIDVATKKRELRAKLEQGDAVIVYSSLQGYCTIITAEEKQKWFSKNGAP